MRLNDVPSRLGKEVSQAGAGTFGKAQGKHPVPCSMSPPPPLAASYHPRESFLLVSVSRYMPASRMPLVCLSYASPLSSSPCAHAPVAPHGPRTALSLVYLLLFYLKLRDMALG